MPFTPFHMGPGLLIKSLLQGSFSLMVFGWTQIVMDIQPLVAIVSGAGPLHGFTHTYIGATLLAIVSAVSGKFLADWALVNLFGIRSAVPIRWWVATLSAFIGSYSHVALDSIMHTDIRPLAPFAESNALLHAISIAALHRFCVYSALIGTALYFLIQRILAARNQA